MQDWCKTEVFRLFRSKVYCINYMTVCLGTFVATLREPKSFPRWQGVTALGHSAVSRWCHSLNSVAYYADVPGSNPVRSTTVVGSGVPSVLTTRGNSCHESVGR